jgi:hypothetical protein
MMLLSNADEGKRIFQKESLQKQFANVYFVHKAGSQPYTNTAIPNPQLFQGTLNFPSNEHMGASTTIYLPLIGIPPIEFNAPICDDNEISMTDFVNSICKSTLHDRPEDPDNDDANPPAGYAINDALYPPTTMWPTSGRGLLARRTCPPLLIESTGNRKDLHTYTTFNKWFTKWLIQRRQTPQDTTNIYAARQLIEFLATRGVTLMHLEPQQLETIDFGHGQVFTRIPIILDPISKPMGISIPPTVKVFRADTFEELGHNLHHFTAPSAALCQFHLRKGNPGTYFFH